MTYKERCPKDLLGRSPKGIQTSSTDNCSTHTHSVKTPVKAQGKIIGYLKDHTFIKWVRSSKHMLRKPPAWCISKEAFYEEISSNTVNIIVEDMERGLIYECPTKVFAEHAFEIQRGNFEPQLALGLRFWKTRGNGHRQLNLWGGDNNA